MLRLFKDMDLYLACAGFAFVSIVTFLLMLARYVYSLSLPGLEEINMIVFVWFLYLAMVYCLRKDEHIRVDVLDMLLNKSLQKIIAILANIILVIFSAIVFYYSMGLVEYNMGKGGGSTPVMNIPYYVIYLALPISFGLFTLFTIIQTIKTATSSNTTLD